MKSSHGPIMDRLPACAPNHAKLHLICFLALTFFTATLLLGVRVGPGLAQSAEGEGIAIEAEQGIEWDREEKLYIARGNAHARSGDLDAFADLMKAHYRDTNGSTEVYLIELEGNVRLETPGEIVKGDYARYSVEKEHLVITGDDLGLESRNGHTKVSAKDKLEYFRNEQRAIARGEAHVLRDKTEVDAEVIEAYFKKGLEGDNAIERIEAKGKVKIRSNGDYASGEEAVYYVEKELATLSGNVEIVKGQNKLLGNFAELDLASGKSRLTGGKAEDGRPTRVQGLILPRAGVNDTQDGTNQDGN